MIAARLAQNSDSGRPSKTSQIYEVSQPQAAKLLNVSRRIGAMLREMIPHEGGKPSHDVTVTADLGINRMFSHRWQKMGAPENGRC